MRRIIVIAAALVLAVGGTVGLIFFSDAQEKQATSYDQTDTTDKQPNDETNDPLAIAFSHNDTFYNAKIDVEITCADPDAEIYFTTNGDNPDDTDKKYTGAVEINAKKTVVATTLKVIAINGEKKSKIYTKSYVTGNDVFNRFDENTLVFVLSTDSYNLYDYYYGVTVTGYTRDEYLASDEYDGGELDYTAPANYMLGGRASERPMYVEVYDSTGKQLIDQQAGARVVGGYSRVPKQKSWRLIARNSYSEGNGKFKYAFFEGATDAYGQLITSYDRITLRNGANDREWAGVRDEVALQLAEDAGFPDTQQTTPAAVFLNGEYYGYAWLHEAYHEEYLVNTYGGTEDNFAIVSNTEDADEGDEKPLADYTYVYELAKGGLTDDAKFEEFCSLVDIDNFILYYAFQTYINNEDWPGNNFKAWRYYPSEDETVTSEYLDGKWRFLMFDVEFSQGLYKNGMREPTLSNLLTGKHMSGASEMLIAIIAREDMREYFVNTICDLSNGACSYEHAMEVLDEKIALYDPEGMYALKNGYTSDWAGEGNFEESRSLIREFYRNRQNVVYSDLMKNFGFENKTYNVTLYNVSGAKTRMSSQVATTPAELKGTYFTAMGVTISAEVYAGYEFSCWEINGTKYTQSSMRITSDMADADGNITVTLFVNKLIKEEMLYVSEVYTSGDADWIELYNPNDVAVSTKNLYLTDDETQLNKFKIATTIVPAKGTLIVVCKNNKSNDALKKIGTNFNLKEGETLILSDNAGNILSRVAIVACEVNQSLTRNSAGTYTLSDLTEGTHSE